MDSGKCNNSNASSPENDHQPEKTNEDSTGTGRSYECTFCKRGFTNAQALGGHMNIHRKDKAKAKKKNIQDQEPSTHNVKRNESYVNSRFLPQTDHHQQYRTSYYGYGVEANYHQLNYQVYLPSSNPSIQTRGYCSDFPVLRPEISNDHVDANLSLRIGLAPVHVEDGDEETKENEVDLELRLGHDP